MGGTTRRLADRGHRLHAVVATFGDKGTSGGLTMETLAKRREEEERQANALLGVSDTTFLGLRDSNCSWSPRATSGSSRPGDPPRAPGFADHARSRQPGPLLDGLSPQTIGRQRVRGARQRRVRAAPKLLPASARTGPPDAARLDDERRTGPRPSTSRSSGRRRCARSRRTPDADGEVAGTRVADTSRRFASGPSTPAADVSTSACNCAERF